MKLKSLISPLSVTCSALLIAGTSSCIKAPLDEPLIATGKVRDANSQPAAQLFNVAKSYETQGDIKKALKTYQKVADQYPLSEQAPVARYQEASILHANGQLIDSFKTYQKFIDSNKSSPLYSSAIQKQSEVAFATANGDIQHNFMGLKSKFTGATVVKMLTQVRDNAPYSQNAMKAQYLIGSVWEDREEVDRAIEGYQEVQKRYPNSNLTPEALYKTGTILVAQSNENNRNKANLDNAKNVFLDLIQQFPKHPRAKDAKAQLAKLRSNDVQRSFNIAEFYLAKEQKASAAFYYREVMTLSPSGSLHEKAKKRLAEIGQ